MLLDKKEFPEYIVVLAHNSDVVFNQEWICLFFESTFQIQYPMHQQTVLDNTVLWST